MSVPSAGQFERPVASTDIEALLGAIAHRAADPHAGIFGPGSASWKVNRESAVFLGAGRAALLQLAHPWVATALEQHSSVMSRPIARFHNTFRIVYAMVFGSLSQAMAAARHLYRLHTTIRGELREDAGAWKKGSHYQANETAALRWVFATLVESAVLACECALGPMAAAEREQYYADGIALAALFGLRASDLPPDWNAFIDYNQAMHASAELAVTHTARKMAHSLLAGAGSWIPIPAWYRALTTDWMPPRLRQEFGLLFTGAEQQAAERARRRIPGVYRRLPAAIRFVGPWHEAQARLRGRTVGPVARLSSRFWIGQTRLPFAA